MAEYNVTRDIRKLAEEAERNKTQDLTLAGLGLGGGFVASQTGGSAKNPARPSNITIQANEAQARANQANLNRQTQQYRSNLNLNQLDPAKNVGIKEPSQFQKSVQQSVRNTTMNPPKFEAGPRPDFRPGAGEAKPTPTKPITQPVAPTMDAKGNPLKPIGRQLPKENILKNIAGSTANVLGNVADKAFRVAPLIIPDTELGDKRMDDLVGGLNQLRDTFPEMTNQQFRSALSGDVTQDELFFNLMKARDENKFVPNVANTIPYAERSDLEKQILANQQSGRPLLESTSGLNETFTQPEIAQEQNNLGVRAPIANIPGGTPSYQANFLERIQEEEPITDQEFQTAQQFALKRGMVFDPKEGYSKADFVGQMFKGQTIGQFLRGEDAPEGFTDVIKETADPREEARKSFEQASKEREQRIADRPDFMEAIPDKPKSEFTLGDYRNLARQEGLTGSAQIARAKEMKLEAERETAKLEKEAEPDKLTPYQEQTLELQRERIDLSKQQFKQAKDEYEAGIEAGKTKEELNNLYKRVQILGLMNDLIPEQNELGFDLEPDVINDYVGVLKEFGVEYDPETQVYKQEGMFGKQLDKEDLAKLSPLLKETKFVKLLEYTSKNNQ